MLSSKEKKKRPPQGIQRKRWDVPLYDGAHSFVWKYGDELVQILSPRKGERILDLGCGTGHLTHRIASFGAGVIGIDKAPGMIAQARKNYPTLQFRVADAARFSFGKPFDAVFSNACLHWIKNPVRVLQCVRRALKNEGRFVAEFGGKGNIRKIVSAICYARRKLGHPPRRDLNPWYFPTVREYSTLLKKQGFSVTYATLFDRLTPLEQGEEGLAQWVQMFAKDFLSGVPRGRQELVMRRVEEKLRGELYRNGTWYADYRRIRVVAIKER